MKNVVEYQKEFFAYFNALKTYSVNDLYVSCVRPSTFNGQDEYAERELESIRDRPNCGFIVLSKPNRMYEKSSVYHTESTYKLRHKKVLTDLYVSCIRPSAFNGQDEYAERELESMGNDLHNNSHYDHNKSPSPFWIIMLPYCCLLHLFFPLNTVIQN